MNFAALGFFCALLTSPPARAAEIAVSTVSVVEKERINRQVPSNAAPVVTDASLEKSAVGPGYTIIPLPAFTYNRNEGSWAGALMPVFRANDKGQVEDIYAPLYLHNKLVGETFTFNYYGYREGTRQYHLIGSYATKVERLIDVSYKDTGWRDGRYILILAANSGKTALNRFYGFGNRTNEQAESVYTMSDINLKASVGVNFTDNVSLLATERFRQVQIEDSVITTLPQTLDLYPSAPGIQGASIWGQGLTLAYDSRDNQLTPLDGAYAALSVENGQDYDNSNRNQWWRVTAEGRHYWPHLDDRAVFVSHAFVDALPIDYRGLVRQGVPFYERPTLGGETTLRGFGRGRFVNSFCILVNLEERITVVQRAIMGNVIELGIAPFVDIGRVGRDVGQNAFIRYLQVNPGVGVRLLARPNIASRLDVAWGRDGANVFVGLDYPF